MEINDRGIVLSSKKYGDSDIIISILTQKNGRYKGLVKRGQSKKNKGIYQPGNIVQTSWKARLENQLGTFDCELINSFSFVFFNDRKKLFALSSACSLGDFCLPERMECSLLYELFESFIKSLETPSWIREYIVFELGILGELGFGLDLTSCVATGKTNDLIYISPKSGCAVSKEAGEPYKSKLLPFPKILKQIDNPKIDISPKDALNALKITGFFLEKRFFSTVKQPISFSRTRLVDLLGQ